MIEDALHGEIDLAIRIQIQLHSDIKRPRFMTQSIPDGLNPTFFLEYALACHIRVPKFHVDFSCSSSFSSTLVVFELRAQHVQLGDTKKTQSIVFVSLIITAITEMFSDSSDGRHDYCCRAAWKD